MILSSYLVELLVVVDDIVVVDGVVAVVGIGVDGCRSGFRSSNRRGIRNRISSRPVPNVKESDVIEAQGAQGVPRKFFFIKDCIAKKIDFLTNIIS